MSVLFDQLCTLSSLYNAWKQIKQKGAAGGIDGISVLDFEDNLSKYLHELLNEIKNKTWNPEPYLRVEIKKNETERRKLGLLSIKDKVVQQAIKTLIEPRFEKLFVNNSYGYRPEMGHTRAVRRTLIETSKNTSRWLLRLDIDDYFDTISHFVLFSRLKTLLQHEPEICRLIELSVRMGVIDNTLVWNSSELGVPQGAVLSPLLANLYLHSFDQFILTKTKAYVRYADDFVIFCQTKEEAESILKIANTYLESKLKLKLNPHSINNLYADGFDFLGFHINKSGLSLSKKRKIAIIEKINHIQLDGSMLAEKSLKSLKGIQQYYAKLLPQSYLLEFDALLMEKLKQVITENLFCLQKKAAVEELLQQVDFYAQQNIINKKLLFKQLTDHYLYIRKLNQSSGKPTRPNNDKLIKQRKQEYRKLENTGSELIVSSIGSFIGKNHKGIVVKQKGTILSEGSSRALKHITVISKEVSISGHAIAFCMDHRIPIDFFDGRGKHLATVVSPTLIENTLWEKQSNMPLARQALLGSKIIYAKIKNQISLIKYFHKYHKGTIQTLQHKYEEVIPALDKLSNKVKTFNVTDTKYRTTLMAYEAQAAVCYWGYVRCLLADDNVEFDARINHGATDIVNSLLNYGYALLYPRIWQAHQEWH